MKCNEVFQRDLSNNRMREVNGVFRRGFQSSSGFVHNNTLSRKFENETGPPGRGIQKGLLCRPTCCARSTTYEQSASLHYSAFVVNP